MFEKGFNKIRREVLQLKTSNVKSSEDISIFSQDIQLTFTMQLDGDSAIARRQIWLNTDNQNGPTIASAGVNLSQNEIDTTREFWAYPIEDSNGRLGFMLYLVGNNSDVSTLSGGGSVVMNWTITVRSTTSATLEAA